ncbi:helix-turn-helix domain-containing protein [Streptomyces sp. NPDC023723]|uniref:helix-turn-helix transcriptional regulator n=1 Tax=Streptomyces sp. NPDC023723 TaxID=3154323 RepID=UPI0033F377C1
MGESTLTLEHTPIWRLLAPPQLAELLAVSDKTLRNWRNNGKGPSYIKLDGGAVRYPVRDVCAWLDEQHHFSVRLDAHRTHEMRPMEPKRFLDAA